MGVIKDFLEGLKNGPEVNNNEKDIKDKVEQAVKAQKTIRAGSDFIYKVAIDEKAAQAAAESTKASNAAKATKNAKDSKAKREEEQDSRE